MAVADISSIDLSVFDQHDSPKDECQDYKSCICVRRILTLMKYYSLLQINSNKHHQNVFDNFIHEIYNTSQLIMDQYHLQKRHNHNIYQIMTYAVNKYKFPPCDIKTCAHSSRLYRIRDNSSETIAFAKEDQDSILPLVIDIMDSIHHFVFHVFECGLRDIGDNKSNEENDDDHNKNNEHYDGKFAKMSARILSKRHNTERFDRMNGLNKFNINIGNDDFIDDTQNDPNYNNTGTGTYLDSIYSNLTEVGINQNVIENLANFIRNEQFGTETLDLDLQIAPKGNIETEIANTRTIIYLKEMFEKATGLFLFFT